MPIIFHEHTKQFHLFNSQVSYIICIMENGQIERLFVTEKIFLTFMKN